MAIMTGCASTQGYFVDRGRDAVDVLTVGIGRGVGAKVHVGPVQTGLIWNEDVFGLRCGEISYWPAFSPINRDLILRRQPPRSFEQLLPLPVIFHPDLGIHGGGESYVSQAFAGRRGKEFDVFNIMPLIPVALTSQNSPAWPFYTQIEAVVALGPSLRLGFNLGELFDFILGWTTLDIFNDDLEGQLGPDQ